MCGYSTASAPLAAIAASIAEPPARSASTPACDARTCGQATMPLGARATGRPVNVISLGLECHSRGGERRFNLRRTVRCGYESSFVRGRRQVHALREHRVKEFVEAILVALHHLGKTRRGRRAEVQAEHAADRLR